MSGSGTAGPGGAVEAGRPHRRVWPRLVVGVAVGVVAVSGALVAVVQDGGGSDGAGAPDEAPAERSRWDHEFPASYAGPVWISVDAADDAMRTVTIRWGPWQRRIVHQTGEPATYEFTKNVTRPGEDTVPTTVTVEPGAEVTFGSGDPPPDAIDVNGDWTRVDPAA